MTVEIQGEPRTYDVRTYGCQMNVHDSERISGLMEDAGYVRAADPDATVIQPASIRKVSPAPAASTKPRLIWQLSKRGGQQNRRH